MKMIHVKWSDDLVKGSEYLDSRRVLYMYYADKEPVYIGKADKQSVKERLHGHDTDGVVEWIRKNISLQCKIKVGELIGIKKFSSELLHDVESLLIFRESDIRGFCKANIINTNKRDTFRPNMKIVNQGFFSPLLEIYFDERK